MRLMWNTRRIGLAATIVGLTILLIFTRTSSSGPEHKTTFTEYPSSHPTIYRPKGSAFTRPQLIDLCHSADSIYGHALTLTSQWAMDGTLEDMGTNYVDSCFPIEIATSQGGRSMGHCSDFVNYIVYGAANGGRGGRLATDQFPKTVFDVKARNCANHSIFIHGEFPLVQLLNRTDGTGVRNMWMPNLEQMDHNQAWIFTKISKVLCKTRITCAAIDKYLAASGISDPPKTQFMSHSSVDVMKEVQEKNINVKRKQDFNKFFHSYGLSKRKHTIELVDCWKRHPEWGQLTVVGYLNKKKFGKVPRNVKIFNRLPIDELRKLQFESGVHICPSQAEGYGHYINEARSLSALVVTTNYPPMNEFVTDGESGILIDYETAYHFDHQLIAPNYFLPEVHVSPNNICSAMERVMALDIDKRKQLGKQARVRYDEDTALLIKNVEKLHEEARSWI
ncbi:hypothetical protein BCR33DRAFT_718818, partial [Rhizoclosmatium globosum]